MPKKDQLYMLIKSLTKTEKRYFTLFASLSGQPSNYLKLFQAIDKQAVYNEAAIKEAFKDSTFVRQLHVTKNNLTGLILKSLRNFHVEHSISFRIMNKIMDINLLYEKELYHQCRNKIEKAIEMATKFENFGSLHELLSLKRKLMLTIDPSNTTEAENILKKENAVLSDLKTINQYWKRSLLQNDDAVSTTKKLRQRLPLQAKILHHHAAHVRNFMNGNPELALKSVSDLIRLLDENFDKTNHDPKPYVAALSNKIGLLLALKRWNEIPALINTIKQVSQGFGIIANTTYSMYLRCRIYNIEMEYYRDTQQWNNALSLIPEIAQFMEAKGNRIRDDYTLLFCYQFAYVFFKRKEFSQSLKWLNRIHNNTFDPVRQDILVFSRLLNIAVHFELKNFTVVTYAIDSTKRFLKKEKFLEKFQSSFIMLFKKLLTAPDGEHKTLLKNALHEFLNDPDHETQQALDYLDLKSWIEEKVNKTRSVSR